MSRYRTRSWRAFDPAAAAVPFTPAVSVRILGLDPGSRRTGFGVIECRGTELIAVAHGCLNVTAAAPTARLRMILEGLQELFSVHHPGEVAVERVFVSRNVGGWHAARLRIRTFERKPQNLAHTSKRTSIR